MKIAKVTLTRQITLISGRAMVFEGWNNRLTEAAHGVKIESGKQAVLIPWHTIESVEYANDESA